MGNVLECKQNLIIRIYRIHNQTMSKAQQKDPESEQAISYSQARLPLVDWDYINSSCWLRGSLGDP